MGLQRRGYFVLCFLLAAVITAKAQTSTWTGSGGTSLWTTATNWSGNTLPSSSSNVQFTGASSLSINLNGNQAVNSLTLSGTNGYTISNNTLTLSSGDITVSSPGSGSVTDTISSGVSFSTAAAVSVGSNATLSLSSTVGGSSLTKSGAGTLIVTGTATYAGTTTVSAGTLQIGNGGATGSLSGALALNTSSSTVNFDLSSNTTYSQAITGNGVIDQEGSGSLTLSSTGISITGSGIAEVTGSGALILNTGGSASVAELSAGNFSAPSTVCTLDIQGSGTTVTAADAYIGVAGETGLLNVTNNATLIVTSSLEVAQAGGTGTATVASGGILQLGNGSTGLSVAGNITDNSSVVFDNSNSVTYAGTLSGTGSLTQEGGGTLILTGTNTYSGATTISSGTLQIGNGGATSLATSGVTNNGSLVFDTSSSLTIAGNITGTGSLVQEGGGTTILTGTNTYSGGTTVSGGTLQINTLTALPGNIVNNAAVTFHTGGTYANTISGTGGVSVTGGSLTLTGTNTYTGTTSVNSSSTLRIGNGGTTGSIANTSGINAEGVVNFDRSDNVTFAGAVNGSSSAQEFAQTGTGTFTLTGNINYGGNFVAGGNGTLVIANGVTSSISNIYVGDADYGGQGTLTLSGGDTVVNNGSYITVGHEAAGILNISNGAILNAEGGLLLGENSGSATVSLNISGGGTLETGSDVGGSGSITLNNGTILFSGSSNLGSSTTLGSGGGSLLADNGTTITLSDGISGTGALTLVGGKFVLMGADTATGGTTLLGTLQIGNGGTTGSISGNIDDNSGSVVFDRSDSSTYSGVISDVGSLTQEGSGTLILTGTNTFFGTTTISAGTLQLGNGGTSGSVSSNITNNASLVFDRSDSPTYSGVISGSGSLAQKGSGKLFLTGANTYSGGTTVNNNATLSIGNGGTSGSISNSSGIDTEGTVDFDRSDNVTYSGAITGSNDLGILAQTGSGTLTLTGSINLNGSLLAAGNGTLLVNNGSTSNVNDGVFVGDATYGSPGTLTLSGSNTVMNNPGFVLVGSQEAGTLNITNGATLNAESGLELGYGSGGAAAALNISGGGILSLGDSIDGSGTVTINNGTINYYGTSGLGCNVIVNSGGATMTSASGSTYDLQNKISGTGSLTLSGSGTLVLTGANTYTGGTTVSGGTVIVDNTAGSGTGTGAVDVKSGAILGGGNGAEFSGTLTSLGTGSHTPTLKTYTANSVGLIGGSLTIESGARLAPGNSVGTLTAASLTLNLGSVLDYEFNGTANDFTEVTTAGGLTLNGGSFDLYQENTTNTFAQAGTYNLIGYSGTLNGSIANLSVANPNSGYYYVFVNDSADGLIQLDIAAVPEPSTWILLMIGLFSTAILTRRRRRTEP